jgi:hypothetical protein
MNAEAESNKQHDHHRVSVSTTILVDVSIVKSEYEGSVYERTMLVDLQDDRESRYVTTELLINFETGNSDSFVFFATS